MLDMNIRPWWPNLLSAVVALLAPESLAYAQIAGVPPAQGLIAAPLTLLVYALIGRSRVRPEWAAPILPTVS